MRSAHATACLILLGAGLLAGACGGGGKDGSSRAVCATGDTRACVGPGACNGAQACLPDHSGFGPCDCGGGGAPSTGGAGGGGATGGASGAAGAQGGGGGVGAGGGNTTGGAGGSDASAGASGADASAASGGAGAGGVDAGASGGSSGSGGLTDAGASDADVVTWSDPGPGDSPCFPPPPSTFMYYNCTQQCGPESTFKCDQATCTDSLTGPGFFWDGLEGKVTFRLPADPGHMCTQCTTPPYELVVRIYDTNSAYGVGVKVSFDGDGWQSALLPPPSNSYYLCPSSSQTRPGCQEYYMNTLGGPYERDVYIVPYDPSHPDNSTTGTPARNVTIEISDTLFGYTHCPKG